MTMRLPIPMLLVVASLAALTGAEQPPAAEAPVTDPAAPAPTPASPAPAAKPAGAAAAPAAKAQDEDEDEDKDEDGDWFTTGRLGFFFTNVSERNGDRSNDPSIGGTNSSTTLLVQLDLSALYLRGPWRVDNTLLVKYGRQRSEGQDWVENTDLVDYDTVASYTWNEPHFWYGAVGADTVITEDPGDGVFEPGIAKVSAGYGQRYEDMLPLTDRLEFRLGVRAQRRWGSNLSDQQKEWEVGPEFIARYERQQTTSLRYWLQYEAFAEFEDMAHVSNLVTAGLDLQVNPFLTVALGARAYYESAPDDAVAGSDALYDNWSWRTETLVGLTFAL
ncbi:MAG: DUF3078 domain-containing protein [Planctomycetes bacterium]|nr:DUF3078 domain-containing protein [Planctomycetota bacterium]